MTVDARTDDAVLADVAQRLRQHRLDRNITQAVLAEQAGVSTPTIQRLEAGASVQWVSVIRVLRALGLLSQLDAWIPEAKVRPLDLLERDGERRKRASPRNYEAADEPWTWGD